MTFRVDFFGNCRRLEEGIEHIYLPNYNGRLLFSAPSGGRVGDLLEALGGAAQRVLSSLQPRKQHRHRRHKHRVNGKNGAAKRGTILYQFPPQGGGAFVLDAQI